MSALNTDKFKKLTNNFSTTLSSAIVGSSDTSMSLSSTTNLPTDTGAVFVIDRVNSSGTATPSVREYVVGVVSGSNVTNLVRGVGNSTAQAHSTGAVVEQVVDQRTINDIVDGILAEHNQDGTHKIGSTSTLTSAKFLTALCDTNGNELIRVGSTASAVNDITVTNAATGNAPQISASGDDTNVSLNLAPKGTGVIQISGSQIGQQALKNPYKFSVYRNSAFNQPGGTAVTPFDTKSYDTGSNVDVTTNKGRFTAPIAGFYHFSSTVTLQTTTADIYSITLYINGSATGGKAGTSEANSISQTIGLTVAGDLQLSAGDYVEVVTFNGSGTNKTMSVGNAPQVTFFSGFLISAT